MKVIVCLDDKNGMLFAGRRQSKDSLLRADILQLTCGHTLWMDSYTFSQFAEPGENIRVDEDYFSKAEPDDYCFVEKGDMLPYAGKVTGVILYRWNRAYPSDKKFPEERFASKWQLTSIVEFAGSSHETITREVYRL